MSQRAHSGTGVIVVGNVVVAILLILMAAVVGGCTIFDFMGPAKTSSCGSACSTPTFISPYSAYILRGDTVRFTACNDYNLCGYGQGTGNVVSQWSVTDSSVATISLGSTAALTSSATSALVRAIAPGRATLSVTFPGGNSYQKPTITVADSSAITSIELPFVYSSSYTVYSDTVRVGGQVTFDVRLKDVGGTIYRAWPTSSAVTDTTVLRLTRQANTYDQGPQMRVSALRAGKAALRVSFLGITATRQVIVVP